jgi:hypothetical protein
MGRHTFWKKKRRSTGQKEQLEQARGGQPDASSSVDKENFNPAPLYRKIHRSKGKVADAKILLQE